MEAASNKGRDYRPSWKKLNLRYQPAVSSLINVYLNKSIYSISLHRILQIVNNLFSFYLTGIVIKLVNFFFFFISQVKCYYLLFITLLANFLLQQDSLFILLISLSCLFFLGTRRRCGYKSTICWGGFARTIKDFRLIMN